MKNSWKYGFVLRYPSDKSALTGIIYEPWHYRYVGKEAAKIMYEEDLCLEEYLEKYCSWYVTIIFEKFKFSFRKHQKFLEKSQEKTKEDNEKFERLLTFFEERGGAIVTKESPWYTDRVMETRIPVSVSGGFRVEKRGEENEQKEDTNGSVAAAVQLCCGDFRVSV